MTHPDVCEGPETGVVLHHRYQLLHVLGAGQFSTVYAAHDRRIKGPVAVKLLKSWCGEREHRRFEIEVVISGRIVHPHVIRMTDAGTHNGQPYAVSPRLAGRQLWRHRGEHWRNVALYMRQYLEGMRALHEASAFVDPNQRTRVLHRDVKPANCMVSPEGHVTIIDLGVIKPMDLKLRETTAGTVVGSTAYMAPEYLFRLERASERSDVYSLGVSFFEMLTGELPYYGVEPDEFCEQIAARREARSVLELRPEIPAALAALVQNAMAPLPLDRPATVATMLDMLETILIRTGGWGLGFGPRVALPPSIDPPVARPLAPAPRLTPLSVLVVAPTRVDVDVFAPEVDAPASATAVDPAARPSAAAPPCDDAAPTLPPPPRPAPTVAAPPTATPVATREQFLPDVSPPTSRGPTAININRLRLVRAIAVAAAVLIPVAAVLRGDVSSEATTDVRFAPSVSVEPDDGELVGTAEPVAAAVAERLHVAEPTPRTDPQGLDLRESALPAGTWETRMREAEADARHCLDEAQIQPHRMRVAFAPGEPVEFTDVLEDSPHARCVGVALERLQVRTDIPRRHTFFDTP